MEDMKKNIGKDLKDAAIKAALESLIAFVNVFAKALSDSVMRGRENKE